DRRAALDLLVQLHRAKAGRPRAEDFVVPRLDALGPMLAEPREAWQGGPYARRAGELLQAHAAGLSVLVTAYAGLAERAAAPGPDGDHAWRAARRQRDDDA